MNPSPFTAYSNMPDDKLKQYGVLAIGLAMAGGFAFGGIFSYAGLTPSGNGQQQGGQRDVPELPNSTFSEGESFEYGFRTQAAFAQRDNLVFVTGIYSSQEELDRMKSYEDFASTFEGNIYIQLVNESNNPSVARELGIIDYPKTVVVGGNTEVRNGRVVPSSETLEDISKSRVREAICGVFRERPATCIE